MLALAVATHASAAPPATQQAWIAGPIGTSWDQVVGPDVGFAEGRSVDGDIERLRIIAEPHTLMALRQDGWDVSVIASGNEERRDYRLPDRTDLTEYIGERSGLMTLGYSRDNRPILALWYGQPPEVGAPAIRVTGAHHGDESSSFEVALDTAEWLAEADGTRTDVTELLDNHTVYVVPWVNPDGSQANVRQNANGIDLNRNYGFEWSAQAFQAGPYPFSEPETRAVRDHGLLAVPHTSLSLHSGATNIGYVWNYSFQDTLEEGLLRDLGDTYADGNRTPGFYVTNGADWYPTRGDTNDWSYGTYGGMDFTVELTRDKTPASASIRSFLAAHQDAVQAVLLRQPTVSGRVFDELSLGIGAELQLQRDGLPTSAPFAASAISGSFARHADGADAIRVSAPGYASKTVPLDSDEPVTVILEAQDLRSDRCAPFGGLPGDALVVPESVGPLATVWRPGVQRVLSVVDGRITMPDDLPPGPYTLVSPDGTAWPHALVVASQGRAQIDAVDEVDDTLVLSGTDFGERPMAWAVTRGASHSLQPLALLSHGPDSVRFDLALAPSYETLDIWFRDGGTTDAFTLSDRDVREPIDTDASVPDDAPDVIVERVGCACNHSHPGGWLALSLLALPLLRRRHS